MTTESSLPVDASSRMLHLLNSFLTVQAIHVAAVLGIADHLAAGLTTIDELATATSAHRPSLYRLLRTLAGAGVFQEVADGRFALTALGETLRSEGPASVRDWALYVGAPEPWDAWGHLRETVKSGEPGFVLAHGLSTYDYLAQHPELAAPFDRWMSRQSDQHNATLVAAYDFSPYRVVADIGGGQGSTLTAILQAHPFLRGILLDQPHVVEDPTSLQAAAVGDRCEVVSGDMLQAVPRGADVYLIKRVLMIWDDEPAIRVLRHCAEALPKLGQGKGKVLVVEMILPPGNDPSAAKSFDLLMLLANRGGRIRTEAEFRELFSAAGLRLASVIPTASPNSILEGVPA
jgi:hypothetical protein